MDVDVLVVGGGPAGLTAGLLAAQAGFETVVVDRALKPTDPSEPGADLRTAALLTPSIALLERVDAWAAARPHATDLATMRIIEAGGRENVERKSAAFEARDAGQPIFGANIANADLVAALRAAVSAAPRIALEAPVALKQLLLRGDAAIATLADGRQIRARLAVGADGRESAVRAAAGVRARRFSYGQTALVFLVSHDAPHQNVSTEILRSGGPFTLVPYAPDADGRPRSSVVWMESASFADRLMALDDEAFEVAVNGRSLDVLGPLRLASRRAAWPIISLLSDRFHGRRAALIAEAAHVVPPIGAQGLNMSLKDAEILVDVIAGATAEGRDIGEESVLARFTRRRWAEAAARVGATAALNGAAIGAAQPIRDLRLAGLRAIFDLPPLRRAAMRVGLGSSGAET